jgi:hypothetical protein
MGHPVCEDLQLEAQPSPSALQALRRFHVQPYGAHVRCICEFMTETEESLTINHGKASAGICVNRACLVVHRLTLGALYSAPAVTHPLRCVPGGSWFTYMPHMS